LWANKLFEKTIESTRRTLLETVTEDILRGENMHPINPVAGYELWKSVMLGLIGNPVGPVTGAGWQRCMVCSAGDMKLRVGWMHFRVDCQESKGWQE
jgi:hypothetical protein